MLTALSPLDGRYAETVQALRAFFSEEALIRSRLFVEVKYLIALSKDAKLKGLSLNEKQQGALLDLVQNFNVKEGTAVKEIEATTRHDVKAVEYYLKKKAERIRGLSGQLEFIHFGLTSEDVNNLAYGILIHDALRNVIFPALQGLLKDIQKMASATAS